MTNKTRNAMLAGGLAAAALAMSGCSLFASAPAAPQTTPSQMLQSEIDELRQQNAALRDAQKAQSDQLAALRQKLASESEQHRRYRDTMATSFEMLEQSVAETLAAMRQAPAEPAIAAQSPPAAHATAAAAVAGPVTLDRAPAAEPTQAPVLATRAPLREPPAPEPGQTKVPRPPPREVAPPQALDTAPQPLAARPPLAAAIAVAAPRPQPFHDPDLTPPAQPRRLEAHPEAKAIYERGFTHFASKDYDAAVKVYESFLRQFPNDIYSDNAQYWIGEAQLRLNRPAEAEAAFRAVLRNYEHRSTLDGYKTPDAILRIGQIALRRGDNEAARTYFREASSRFPNSSAGRKAARESSSLRVNTADNTVTVPNS